MISNNNNKSIMMSVDKIQSLLKLLFFISTMLYLAGKGVDWLLKPIMNKLFSSRTGSLASQSSKYFTLQVPVPFINIKKLFGSYNDGEGNPSLSSSQPRPIKGQYSVEFLNGIGRKIDFLHQNYTRYLNKLTQGNQTMMMTSSTVVSGIGNESTFQKRVFPIVFKNKFGLAKDILMRDLLDTIEKCQIKSEMYRQQIKAISKFVPPSFFLLDPKLSPYYWILTDIDYKLMPPFLRNFVLYTNTSTVGNTSTNQGLFNNNYSTTSIPYSNQLQFPTTSYNSSSMFLGSVLPPHILDRIRYDWKFFITQNRSISHRFEYLYNAFLKKQSIIINSKQERKKFLKEFENECFKLLKKRRKLARKKMKTVRMKHLRPSEREKSQLKAQFNKLKQLELSSIIV